MPAPDHLRHALLIAGPTACGKSGIAIALAQQIGGEVINADAFQLYSGIPITSAQPSPEEQYGVPHHLLGVLPLQESCDAQRFRDLAIAAIADVLSRDRWPILVGGSGLYMKALTHGLAPLPPADPQVRAQIAALDKAERVVQLLALDPAARANVDLANDRYVSRALEVCLITGQPQSQLRQTWSAETQPSFMGTLLQRDREELYSRIDQRVTAMAEAGLVAEIAALPSYEQSAGWEPPVAEAATTRRASDPLPISPNPFPASSTALKAIGVREIQAHLAGASTLPAALDLMRLNTRHYAKRQMTWFRREHGWQTICLGTADKAHSSARRITETFPCLCHRPQSAPSSST